MPRSIQYTSVNLPQAVWNQIEYLLDVGGAQVRLVNSFKAAPSTAHWTKEVQRQFASARARGKDSTRARQPRKAQTKKRKNARTDFTAIRSGRK